MLEKLTVIKEGWAIMDGMHMEEVRGEDFIIYNNSKAVYIATAGQIYQTSTEKPAVDETSIGKRKSVPYSSISNAKDIFSKEGKRKKCHFLEERGTYVPLGQESNEIEINKTEDSQILNTRTNKKRLLSILKKSILKK